MLSLGPLSVIEPWALLALAILPAIYWLLRITPPAPRAVEFPPTSLLRELVPKATTPAHTPLWLLLFRLLIALFVILALARPVLDYKALLLGQGPVVLVVDDGWPAAPHWHKRIAQGLALIEEAERQNRPVLLIKTAPVESGETTPQLLPAGQARAILGPMLPKPWRPSRGPLAQTLDLKFLPKGAEAVFLSDGIEDGAAFALAERLQQLDHVQIFVPPDSELARALGKPQLDAKGLKATLHRAKAAEPTELALKASADDGRLLGRQTVAFGRGQTAAEALIELPVELRNDIARLDIENENSAGAAFLLDERWRRRAVGLVGSAAIEKEQPLLSGVFYLERALQPFAEIHAESLASALARDLSVLILADVGRIPGGELQKIEDWIEAGGVLIRFAGPKFAANADRLTPVLVRRASRQLGGPLSWSEPLRLAPFPEHSPFAGLTIPDDVVVRGQVLAEPDIEIAAKTWAELTDGTPLVTAKRQGRGLVVLVHTSADAEWSNLALSGLFVEMLRRMVELGQGKMATDENEATLSPYWLLDGFGQLKTPSGSVKPLAGDLARIEPGPEHPPGLYGTEGQRRALNAFTANQTLRPIERWPAGVSLRAYGEAHAFELRPWLLAFAISLLLADWAVAFYLLGLIRPRDALAGILAFSRSRGLTGLLVVCFVALAPPSLAAERDLEFAFAASSDVRLAYVVTGSPEVDRQSRAGLIGLSNALSQRTTLEPAAPIGVDLERHEILFFPFLYWPIVAEQRPLSASALSRIASYMKTGGLILFDTRDEGAGFGPGSEPLADPRLDLNPGARKLASLLKSLDLPPLAPVPPDHILTRAFYLLQDFPGRYTTGRVWVERHPGGSNDGVSSLVIGGNDWAGAWAMDAEHRGSYLPGGRRQHELALRFGVNLVMYALTGNYKADQVHVPIILERLGQ
jgi:hypothetical protein